MAHIDNVSALTAASTYSAWDTPASSPMVVSPLPVLVKLGSWNSSGAAATTETDRTNAAIDLSMVGGVNEEKEEMCVCNSFISCALVRLCLVRQVAGIRPRKA